MEKVTLTLYFSSYIKINYRQIVDLHERWNNKDLEEDIDIIFMTLGQATLLKQHIQSSRHKKKRYIEFH